MKPPRLLFSLLTLLTVAIVAAPCRAADAPEKVPAPEAAAQQDAIKQVWGIYAQDTEKAKKPAQKAELARKVLEAGVAQDGHTADKFGLLAVAKSLAYDAGDCTTVFQAIDEIDKVFQIDALAQKAEIAAGLAKLPKSQDDIRTFVTQLDHLIDQAILADRYDVARQLSTLAISVAHAGTDVAVLRLAAAHTQQIKDAEAGFIEIKGALATLHEKPTDPDANFKVGKYCCYIKGDWDTGIAMLILGNDAPLRAMAQREFDEPAEPDALAALGDGWWDLADKESGTSKMQLRRRAAHWYHAALPKSTGLAKARLEKRLAMIEEVVAPAGSRAVGMALLDTQDHFQAAWRNGEGQANYVNNTKTLVISGSHYLGSLHADSPWTSFAFELFCVDHSPKDLSIRVNNMRLNFKILTEAARGQPLPVVITCNKARKILTVSILNHIVDHGDIVEDDFDKRFNIDFRWFGPFTRIQLRNAILNNEAKPEAPAP